MDREVLVDGSHRGLQPRQPGGKPLGTVAKLNYNMDCVKILRKAREAGPLQFKGSTIHISPDYPPSVACIRSALIMLRSCCEVEMECGTISSIQETYDHLQWQQEGVLRPSGSHGVCEEKHHLG